MTDSEVYNHFSASFFSPIEARNIKTQEDWNILFISSYTSYLNLLSYKINTVSVAKNDFLNLFILYSNGNEELKIPSNGPIIGYWLTLQELDFSVIKNLVPKNINIEKNLTTTGINVKKTHENFPKNLDGIKFIFANESFPNFPGLLSLPLGIKTVTSGLTNNLSMIGKTFFSGLTNSMVLGDKPDINFLEKMKVDPEYSNKIIAKQFHLQTIGIVITGLDITNNNQPKDLKLENLI